MINCPASALNWQPSNTIDVVPFAEAFKRSFALDLVKTNLSLNEAVCVYSPSEAIDDLTDC